MPHTVTSLVGCGFATVLLGEAVRDAAGQLLAVTNPALAAAVPTPRCFPVLRISMFLLRFFKADAFFVLKVSL